LLDINGHTSIPSEKLDFGFEKRDENNSLVIQDMVSTDHHLFCDYYYHNKPRVFCYDYAKKSAYYLSGGFDDDFYKTGYTKIRFCDTEKGLCYFSKDGIDAGGKIEGVDQKSNPVLFLFEFK
jgi:hypothetical protein